MTTVQAGVPALTDLPTPTDLLRWVHQTRENAPVAWLPAYNGYLFTSRADVTTLLKDRRLKTANATRSFARLSPEQLSQLEPLRRCISLWMGHSTTAARRRFQLLLRRYFTPAVMEQWRPNVRRITEDLLDNVLAAGRMDVITDLAFPLPANVIADVFGMPVQDRHMLPVWSGSVGAVFRWIEFEDLLAAQDGIGEFQRYLGDLVESRRANLGDDMISELLRAETDGEIDTEEIVANCLLTLFASLGTTANVITHGISLLLDHPEQLALLRERPEFGPAAVEEILRCEGTVNTLLRDVAEPFEYNGLSLNTGDRVYVSLYAANHDPAFIADPDRFDITRDRSVHVAFGTGLFYCLGASLARVQVDECLKVFLERIPNPRRDGDRLWVEKPPVGHRIDSLPIAY